MLTITEALAELKTIQKRIEKKRDFILDNIGRPEYMKDPFVETGGAQETLSREFQSIKDLEQRTVLIRSSVLSKNLSTDLEVCGQVRPIQDWLTWRKEVSGGCKSFLSRIVKRITEGRQEAAKRGSAVSESGGTSPNDLVLHVSEVPTREELEKIEEILGELDGKLSLINARTMVDV